MSSSVVVLAVRKGNPKSIKGWDDLVKPGVEHRHAEPGLVGRGPVERARGLGPHRGQRRHRRRRRPSSSPSSSPTWWRCPAAAATPPPASSAAPATCCSRTRTRRSWPPRTARSSTGSCPDTTILIENPGAILKNADPKAKAWLDFVLSKDGQRQFALKGFRPDHRGRRHHRRRGRARPEQPVPGAEEAAHRGRRTSRAGRRCRRSSSPRRTASSSRSSPRPGRRSDLSANPRPGPPGAACAGRPGTAGG